MHIISAADFSPILLENALFCRQNACFKSEIPTRAFHKLLGNFLVTSVFRASLTLASAALFIIDPKLVMNSTFC